MGRRGVGDGWGVPGLIEGIVETVYEFTRTEQGVDGVPQSDMLTTALLAYPTLRGEMGTYPVEVDERAGLTRGYLSVDVDGVTGAPARTRIIESADGERFLEVVLSLLRDRAPDRALSAQLRDVEPWIASSTGTAVRSRHSLLGARGALCGGHLIRHRLDPVQGLHDLPDLPGLRARVDGSP